MTVYAKLKRLRFDRASLLNETSEQCRVEVAFSVSGRVIIASAAAENCDTGRLRAAARATLKAIEQAAGGKLDCSLADLDQVHALGKDLIAVLVDVVFEGREMQLFGSCQTTGSPVEAAVRATLNATNRFMDLAARDVGKDS